MCLAPSHDYETKKRISLNSARTFGLFEEIQHCFHAVLPFKRYTSGCYLLAHAGAHVLRKCGLSARATMCLQPNRKGPGFKAHVICTLGDLFVDFKMATYKLPKKQGGGHRQDPSRSRPGAWFPPGKQVAPPSAENQALMTPSQRANFKELAAPLRDLLRQNPTLSRDMEACVASCEHLFSVDR
jgi:hypothetical protein